MCIRDRVNALPDFGEGVYRLINYGGALTVSYTHLDVYKRQVSRLPS